MKKPDHNNLIFFYHEVNSVRKPSKQTTPQFAINSFVKEGIPRNLSDAGVKYPKEFLTKPR